MIKHVSVLGSTGSVGTQALEICDAYAIQVEAVAAYSNVKLLEEQIRRFRPKAAAIADAARYADLKLAVADCPVTLLSGPESLEEMAATIYADGEMLLNAVVGMAGLKPTLAAIEAGKSIALANKETLVAGGDLVMRRARGKGVSILPVDSEHSAIFQCLSGHNRDNFIHKIILTASGGPFRGMSLDQLEKVTPEDALKHPNWSMGRKITIDSATMMNKGLEVIEAVHLFGVTTGQIEVVVHPESVVHSAVEFVDGAVMAQMGMPEMTIPIQYAFSYPDRMPTPVKRLSLTDYGALYFYKPDLEAFGALKACIQAIDIGGLLPAVANGANEAAVPLFLEKRIGFNDIPRLVTGAMDALSASLKEGKYTLEDVEKADRQAREYVWQSVGGQN